MKTISFTLNLDKWVNNYFICKLGKNKFENLLGCIHGVSDWVQIKPTDNLQIIANANSNGKSLVALSGGKPYYTFWIRGHTFLCSYPESRTGGSGRWNGLNELYASEVYAYLPTLTEMGFFDSDNNLIYGYGQIAAFASSNYSSQQLTALQGYADVPIDITRPGSRWTTKLNKFYSDSELKAILEKLYFSNAYIIVNSKPICKGLNVVEDSILNQLPNYNPKQILAIPGFNTEQYNFSSYKKVTDDFGDIYVINPIINFYATNNSYKTFEKYDFSKLNTYNITGDLTFITSKEDLDIYSKTLIPDLPADARVSIGSFSVGDRLITGYWHEGSNSGSTAIETILEIVIGCDVNEY